MVRFSARIGKFGQKGEKSGWTYVTVPAAVAEQLYPGCHRSFRVKGKLDQHPIRQTALLPMGDGDFILPLNASLRKALGKDSGASLELALEADRSEPAMHPGFAEALKADADARAFFSSQPPAHQRYYSKWIERAKTEATRTRRIVLAVAALGRHLNFAEMLRWQREQRIR